MFARCLLVRRGITRQHTAPQYSNWDVRVCAPPDEEFAALLARVGVPLVPLGPTVRSVVAGTKPPTAKDAFRLAAELVAARFDTLTAAAEGCEALLATGLMPAGARDVAEKLGIRYVCACFHTFGLPSRHFPPGARPGKQSPQEETDNLRPARDHGGSNRPRTFSKSDAARGKPRCRWHGWDSASPRSNSVILCRSKIGLKRYTVYHCHILNHEDKGMMATLEIVR
jgi:hypothetical protein